MLRFLPWILFSLLCVNAHVHAQASADQKAAAEALFDKGLQFMKQGEYAQACPYLEQSNAVERGIGTMLYLADCYERLGRTASAWAMFREAASAAQAEGQGERAQQGSTRAAALEPQLARLAILVPPAAQVPGLQVFRNGQSVPNAVWGVAIPVDPGAQRVEARAPGYEAWSHSESVGKGAQLSMTVPPLTAAPTEPGTPQPLAASAAPEAAPPAAVEPAADSRESHAGSGQRTAAFITGGAGIVALGLGTYFGIDAMSKNSDAEDQCPNNECSSPGFEAHESAQTSATLANVFVIGGGALVAAGLVLYFTAPKPEHASAQLRLGPSSASLSVKF